MKVAFLGSPHFAIPALRRLAAEHTVVGVVTQPDRPAGRGRRLTAPPVRSVADELGLAVIQPEKASTPEAVAVIRSWQPDVLVVVAYGQLLRRPLLEMPPHGCLNVHASLLPRWRGASPIEHALIAGDDCTGVTLMRMDEGLDTGPMLAQRSVPIRADHDAGSLRQELADLGAEVLSECLPDAVAGKLRPTPQDDALATLAPRLTRDDAVLDPALDAVVLQRRIRAFSPQPGARFRWGESWLIVRAAKVVEELRGRPGLVLRHGDHPAVVTGGGGLALLRIQAPGGRPQGGDSFLAGHPDLVGSRLAGHA